MRWGDMPLMFFNLHECGAVIADPEGSEVADLGAARERALKDARSIMCAEVEDGRLCLDCCIEVRDEEGGLLLQVPFREAVAITGA
jgi:hypothetical protein